jgi:hypothetical protein
VTRSCQRSLSKGMACDHPSLAAHTPLHLLSNDWSVNQSSDGCTYTPVERILHVT